jgi:hypothetical protein
MFRNVIRQIKNRKANELKPSQIRHKSKQNCSVIVPAAAYVAAWIPFNKKARIVKDEGLIKVKLKAIQ